MAFKLTKYSYKSLRQMSVQDRLAMAQDREMGQWLLSLLTPSQFVELFPDYYRRGLPDISGFLKAMPSSMSAAKQAAAEEQLQNTASGAAAGANMQAGGWRKKWQEGISRATPTKAGVVPPPQLSPEQAKNFQDLKSGPMAADDPRAKMFAGLTPEQMTQVGISKVKKDGKEFFQYAAPTVTEEEAKKSLSKTEQARSIERVADRLGVPPKDLAAVMHYESAGSMSTSKWGGTGGNYLGLIQFGPAERKQFGVYPGQPFDEQAEAAGKFLEQRGLKRWLESHPNATQEEKRIALYSTINAGSPNESNWRKSDNGGRDNVITHTQRIFREHYGAAEQFMGMEGPVSTDYSQRAIQLAQERLIRQLEERRIGSLAEFTSAQLPSPGSAEANAMVGGDKNATAVAERIKNEFGNLSNQQCVALAKAYVGATGSVTDWRKGTNILDGTLKPGTPIATFMDRSGNPSSLYDAGGTGAPGNHTTHAAVFMDYVRDGAGKITGIKVMEQYVGSGGAKEKVYPVGGFGTNNAANYFSINDTQGRPLGPNNPMLQTAPTETPPAATDKPPVPTPAQPAPQVETPVAMNKPAEAAPASPKAAPQAAPQITPERYNVDVAKFIAAIKNTADFKSNPLSFMASDSMITSGFNDDARVKAAGVYLDDKGVMHFKKGMTPDVKQVMAEFDTKSFMTKIEDKKKEEKKPDVKPVEQKPVEKPPAAAPAQPAPQVEVSQVKPNETPKEAPAKVKTNAMGGDNKVNTEQISAYPIGGLKGDNVVVVNKQQQPLFTMNTNESVTMNPKTDMATVTPNTKERKVGEVNRPSIVEGMFDQFNQSVRELSSRFDQNKGVPERQDRPDAFNPEGGAWLNNLNKTTETQFHSPSARRAFYRAGGGETGEPNSGFHYSHGNRS